MTSAKSQMPQEPTDGEARSVQGPGLLGTLQDTSATTTLGIGQTFNMTAWAGHYIMVEAEVADVLVLFQWDNDGTQPTPAAGNFDATIVAKDAGSPSVIIPERIIAGAPPRAMVVPQTRGGTGGPGRVWLAYKGATATGTIKVKRG